MSIFGVGSNTERAEQKAMSGDSECSGSKLTTESEDDKAKIIKLRKCIEQVRSLMPSKFAQQKKFVEELPSPRLKTFLALALTTYAENVNHMDAADHLAVMKVIDNRVRRCVNGGSDQANAWDIVVKQNQFSVYNAVQYRKQRDSFLSKNEKNPGRMRKTLAAFLKFQCAKFEPPDQWEKTDHYKANYVNPSWARKSQLVKNPSIDGIGLTKRQPLHQFYSREWSCNIQNPPLRSKAGLETKSPQRFALLQLLFENSYADGSREWQIFDGKGKTFLRLKTRGGLIQTLIESDPEGAKILSVKPVKEHPFIEIIEYSAGEFGTSQIIQVKRRVLFDTRSNRFIGDYPYSVTAIDGRRRVMPQKDQPEQPRWTIDSDGISIYDPESEEEYTVQIGENPPGAKPKDPRSGS